MAATTGRRWWDVCARWQAISPAMSIALPALALRVGRSGIVAVLLAHGYTSLSLESGRTADNNRVDRVRCDLVCAVAFVERVGICAGAAKFGSKGQRCRRGISRVIARDCSFSGARAMAQSELWRLKDPVPLCRCPPFLLEPQFVGRVWGFRDLRPWYDRPLRPDKTPSAKYGSRAMSAGRPQGGWRACRWPRYSASFYPGNAGRRRAGLGLAAAGEGDFCAGKLSVQVHPDDEWRGSTGSLAAKPSAGMRWLRSPARRWPPDSNRGHDGADPGRHSRRHPGREPATCCQSRPATWCLLMRARCTPSGRVHPAGDAAELRSDLSHVSITGVRANCTSRSRWKPRG